MRNKATTSIYLPLIAALFAVLNRSIIEVGGFSPRSRIRRSARSYSHFQGISVHSPSYLKVFDNTSKGSKNTMEQDHVKKFRGIFRSRSAQPITLCLRFWSKVRRSVLTMTTIILVWFGAAATHTPVSRGSSSSMTIESALKRKFLSSSLDQMVDKYAKDRMYDDDIYDPVESIYKEAMDDRLKGAHPKELKEITSSVLGQNVIKAGKKASGTGFSGLLMKTVTFLRKQGFSEMQAIALLTGLFVIGVPAIFFSGLMQIATQNKRSMNRLMKNRYGETYSVDASEKIEEDVDVPDDDDDDDDDDDKDDNK